MDTELLLVGCGNMGSALLRGWLDQDIDTSKIHIIEPIQEFTEPFSKLGANTYQNIDEIDTSVLPLHIFFAVKPQVMDAIISEYKRYSSNSIFISIAAGKNIAYFEKNLGKKSAIIRAMPNTPATVRRAITVACGNKSVTKKIRSTSLSLLNAVGDVEWINNEGLIDTVTAVSGSGPAYVFLLAEAMIQSGVNEGLDVETARKIVIKTIAGSGELLLKSQDDVTTLRKNVTSPGGTTEAALSVLMQDNRMENLFSKAISAAVQRSRKLAG